TSHLHVALMALAAAITRAPDMEDLSGVLNIVLQSVTLVLITRITRRRFKSGALALLSALCFAVNAYCIQEVWLGKESSLLSLVLICLLWVVDRQRWRLLGWCTAALLLTRPESIFSCLIAALWSIRYCGVRSLKGWIAPWSLVAAWYLFLYSY